MDSSSFSAGDDATRPLSASNSPSAPLGVPNHGDASAPGMGLGMGPGATAGQAQELDPLRRRALLLLDFLGDESPSLAKSVRSQLLDLGKPALSPLRRAARHNSARVRTRARSILSELEWMDAWRRLTRWATRGCDLDLESALFSLGRLENPRLDARGYKLALDAMGKEVRARVAKASDELSAPMALADYLGNELGYIGVEVGFDHPDNIHLHRAIERKRGMPLTLTAIYLLVARRAGLRAAAVPLPGHVLLRLYAGRRTLLIDPFHGGRMRTRADCIHHLERHGLVPRPVWFQDATDAQLFQRQVRNLMSSMQARSLRTRSDALAQLARALARTEASSVTSTPSKES